MIEILEVLYGKDAIFLESRAWARTGRRVVHYSMVSANDKNQLASSERDMFLGNPFHGRAR